MYNLGRNGHFQILRFWSGEREYCECQGGRQYIYLHLVELLYLQSLGLYLGLSAALCFGHFPQIRSHEVYMESMAKLPCYYGIQTTWEVERFPLS